MSYFEDREFFCKCGRPECDRRIGPAAALRLVLDRMREIIARPIIVTSGNRCPYWNRHEGGVEGSEHDRPGGCEGADLVCRTSAERWAMLDAARHAGFVRLGIGPTFLHVGVGLEPGDVQDVVWTYYPKTA